MKTTRSMVGLTVVAAIGLWGAGTVPADVVTVPGFSFEAPVTGTYNPAAPTDWGVGGSAGYQNIVWLGTQVGGPVTGGTGAQAAYANDTASVWSAAAVTAIAAHTTYTLTVDVANRSNFAGTAARLRFFAGNLSTEAATTGDFTETADNTFRPHQLTWTVAPGSPYIGQGLYIMLSNTSPGLGQFEFDNVRLDATALPAPLAFWKGNVNGVWDINATANWTTNGVSTTYVDGYRVAFDDTATGATTVNNTDAVSPSSITVDCTTKAYTIGGKPIAGCPLTKSGANTLTLTATNTLSGITINAGTLTIGGAGLLGGGTYAGVIAGNGAFVYASSANQTLSGDRTGTGSRMQNGPGMLTLSKANPTGVENWTVNGGILQATSDRAFGANGSTVLVADGATADINGQYLKESAFTISGTGVGGNGALTMSTAGYWHYTGNITLAGDATVNFGYREDLLPASGSPVLDLAGHTLTKNGAGLWYLGQPGQPLAITSGNIIINAGLFAVRGGANIGGTGMITINGTGQFGYYDAGNTISRPITVSNTVTTGGFADGGSGPATVSSDITLNGTATVSNGGGGGFNFSGAIGGAGGMTLSAGSTITLSGSLANTYAGDTVVNSGYLVLSKPNNVNAIGGNLSISSGTPYVQWNANEQIPDTATINMGTGSYYLVLELLGHNETVAGLSGTGGFIENRQAEAGIDTSGTLIVSQSANTTYSGVIRDNGGGSGTGALALVKSGNGVLTLNSGPYANSFTGGTTVSGGTLALGSQFSPGVGVIRGNLAITSGGTVTANTTGWSLGYGTGTDVTAITITGGTLSFNGTAADGGTSAATVAMTGGTISGSRFDWYNGQTSTPTLSTVATSTSAAISSGINLRLSALGSLTFDVAQGTVPGGVDLLVSGAITQTGGGQIVKSGTGTMVLSGANTYNGMTTVSGGTLRLGASDTLALQNDLTLTGGAIDGGAAVNHLGYLTVANGATSTIRIGAGGELSFKESWTIAWNGHVNIAGTLASTSLRFGTTRGGLTPAQLQMMSCNGSPVDLDAAGYLVKASQGTVFIVR